ncbi:hypothetical protein GCM10010211_85050 [Streptomyces albospinus]|uniref:Uncharacterized protein n=1 Tax=Streptomyces albospinus TaxID=285515 RepID=A0ABQ2VPH2_9ACTN|nr:hypothetical protein GCM10010211_85050 [Streptomyces albospinus]
MNITPSSSRTLIARLPFGNAARATRTVSAGTSPGTSGFIDTRTPPQTPVGLQDHNQVLETDVTHGTRIRQQRPREGGRPLGPVSPQVLLLP